MFFVFLFVVTNILVTFAATQLARQGLVGCDIIKRKGRLRTLSSTIKSRKFEFRQEDTATGTSTLGVLSLLLLYLNGIVCNISRRGPTALLILDGGNARA